MTAGESAADAKRVILEPLTNYAVARVRKDLRDGRTTVGAVLTAVNRSLEGTQLAVHDQAYTAGLEAAHRFWDDLDELGKQPGEHVVLAKLNYWIGL